MSRQIKGDAAQTDQQRGRSSFLLTDGDEWVSADCNANGLSDEYEIALEACDDIDEDGCCDEGESLMMGGGEGGGESTMGARAAAKAAAKAAANQCRASKQRGRSSI